MQHFDEVMPLFLRKAIAVCMFLMLAGGTAWSGALPPGFVEGHLKIASLGAVDFSDAMPRQTVTAEKYAEYPLIVLSQDGQAILKDFGFKPVGTTVDNSRREVELRVRDGNSGVEPIPASPR